MPGSSAAGKPWEGMHWSDQGTREWRDSLTDEQVDEWRDWQNAEEEAEEERYWREHDARDQAWQDQIEKQAPSDPDAPAQPLETLPPAEPAGATIAFVDDRGNALDAIVNDQPVRIQVSVPRRPGENPPEYIDVTVSGTQTTLGIEYAGTEEVRLRWSGNVNGPAIYRSEPLTIERGGGGAGKLDVGGLEVATGDMDGFAVQDGDVIAISFGTTSGAVQVFTSSTRLQLTFTMEAIGAAHTMYTNVLVNLRGLEAEIAKAPDSPQKTDVLQKIEQVRAAATEGVRLAQNATRYVNTVDVLDHQKLAVAELYAGWLGLYRPMSVVSADATVQFGPTVVDPRDESRIVYETSQYAKEEVKRIMWAGLTQATIGGYRLLAQATLVAQIMTLTGTTEMGETATELDKWGAFWDLVTQGALMGAMVKWNYDTTVGHTTARIPRAKPVTDQATAMGAPSGTPVASEAAGMLRQAGLDAQLVARKHDVAIQVRFTNPDAMVPRATGAIPKPMAIKSKTIKPIDREIGAPEGAVEGAPGLFEPRLPARGNRSDAEWQAIQERYNLRKGEWEGAIGDYTRGLVDKGEFQLRDGMVVGRNGEVIAGDYDLFEITNLDGAPVSPALYDTVVNDLMAAPGFQAAHGAHMRWNPRADDPGYHIDFTADLDVSLQGLAKWQADRSIFRSIIERHQPGGEGLITFAPNRPPVVTYAGDAVGPKFAELGITVPPPSLQGSNIFVRPTLFVATTQQLLDGRLPDGPGWNWTHAFDWPTEVDNWTRDQNGLLEGMPQLQPFVPSSPVIVETSSDGGRLWRRAAAGGVLAGGVLLGGFLLLNQNQAAAPVAVVTPSPSSNAVPATQPGQATPGETSDPGTRPTESPTPAQPSLATSTPPTPQPTEAPDPNAPPTQEELRELAAAQWPLMVGDLVNLPDDAAVLVDASEDLFTLSGNVFDGTPWIDLRGAVGFQVDLDRSLIRRLNADYPCGRTIDPNGLLVSCNQTEPMQPGRFVIILTGWNASLPDPFPPAANCSWAVQTNLDNDLATGFPNPPRNHPLAGSDRYLETLMFWNQEGDFQNYMLGTDYDAPPRTDTNMQYGNLFSRSRAFILREGGEAPDTMWAGFIIPQSVFAGDNFSVHGYCFGDVSDPFHTTAIDAIGSPSDDEFPTYGIFPGLR